MEQRLQKPGLMEVKNLSENKFGVVRLVIDQNRKYIVIRQMFKDQMQSSDKAFLSQEIENLKLVKHHNIVKFYNFQEDD